MSKIFFAELRRLFHFRLYYIECAAVVLYSLSLFYSGSPVIDSFLFYIMIVIGAFSAVCVSQFIGMEYSCGTIRNKLATGHTKNEIYFAQLILHTLAAIIFFHLSILIIAVTGAVFGWTYYFSFQALFGYYFACICTIIFITAISVFVSMLNSSNLASLVILLVLYVGLTMTGSNFHNALREQEMRVIDTQQAETSPDGHYIDDRTRMGFEYLLLINPYGQAAYESMPIFESHGEYRQAQILENPLPKIFLFSAVESLGLTAVGISAFKKKEIK